MVYAEYPCDDQPMELLTAKPDLSSREAKNARIWTPSINEANNRAEPVTAPRKEGFKAPQNGDFNVDRYAYPVLRPLTAACVLRDCSLRIQSSPAERRACRTLMREAAIKWRRGLAMADF